MLFYNVLHFGSDTNGEKVAPSIRLSRQESFYGFLDGHFFLNNVDLIIFLSFVYD